MFEPTGRYWVFVIITLLLTAMIGYATQATARLLQHWKPDRNILLLPSENGLRIALIPILVGLAMLSGRPADVFGFVSSRLGENGLIGLVVGLALALFFWATTVWLHQGNVDKRIYSTAIIEAILPRSQSEALLVSLAMIPSVLIEELLFRSLLLGGLQPLAPPVMLLIITSLLFGALHSPQGTWGIFGASLAGLVFGGLFLWRGSLIAPCVAHYVANMVQVGLAMKLYQSST